jgi:transcriptional regulator with XRE-family HTH domain
MTYRQADKQLFATVGSRIRAVRLARDLSGEDIAKKLKIARPTLVNWETGATVVVPDERIEAFAKLTQVSAKWLKDGKGEPPPLDFSKIPDKYRNPPAGRLVADRTALPPSNVIQLESNGAQVTEITPRASAHARGLDTAPQATWSIPREVLTLGFNCDPEQGFIKRVPADGPPLPDGTPVNRGDYVLIDSSRNVINEPGLYYVSDPSGKEVRRVIVSKEADKLVGILQLTNEPIDLAGLEVLGRATAVFHAI